MPAERRRSGLLDRHDGCHAIQTLPGIGPVVGAVIVAEIGDVRRLGSAGRLCSWAGSRRGTASQTSRWRLRSVLTVQPCLRLHTLGTFPGREGALFLGVVVTAELLAFHAEVHAALAGRAIGHWPYYQPGSWVPIARWQKA
jgi:hypothetical protein